MSTYTPRLQLKRNDGSDAFLRQDFVDNWNKLDATPGVYVCTSSSLPTWTSAQAGRLVFQTDIRQFLEWTGTGWVPPLATPSSWSFSVFPAQYVAKGATVSYTLGTLSTTAPGTLSCVFSARVGSQTNDFQSAQVNAMVDGVDKTLGSTQGFVEWAKTGQSGPFDHRHTSVMANAQVGAGTHTLALQVAVGNTYSPNVYVGALSVLAILTNSTTT